MILDDNRIIGSLETINYSGYVKEIFVFHTILKTIDNKIMNIILDVLLSSIFSSN